MDPFFSVIVPVYNVEAYLRQCLDSILAQTYGDFELILSDDGSADGSGAICDEYAARDGRVSVLHGPNRGVVAAREAALDAARGEYICFVDGDDWVRKDWLETVCRRLMENGGADMLAFDLATADGGPDQHILAAPGYYDRARMEREIFPYMLWDRRRPFMTALIPGYQCTKVLRRTLLREHYLRDGSITVYEDMAMLYECLYNAASLYVCTEPLYIYRRRPDSAVRRFDPDEIANMKRCRDYAVSHLGAQAPETVEQIDAFFMSKLLHAVFMQARQGPTLRQAARRLGTALDETGLARDLSPAAFPARIRLFLGLMRRRAYYLTVLVYQLRLWLSRHRPGAKGPSGG